MLNLWVYNVEHGGSVDVPITDNIELMGFSFVGNPGNAKSGGYEPSLLKRNEEEHLNRKEMLDKVLCSPVSRSRRNYIRRSYN